MVSEVNEEVWKPSSVIALRGLFLVDTRTLDRPNKVETIYVKSVDSLSGHLTTVSAVFYSLNP